MPTTPNHDIEIPPARDDFWAAKMERNLDYVETTLPLCASAGTLDGTIVDDPHTPHDGAWVLARDTGALFIGDGAAWTQRGGVPRTASVSATGDGTAQTFTLEHGLGTTPLWVGVTPTSTAAGQPHHVVGRTATEVSIEYAAPPTDGAALSWDLAVIPDDRPAGQEDA